MYQIFITPSAGKEVKKLSKPKKVEAAVFEAVQKLKNNPYLGEKLSGSLHFLYSLHFRSEGKNYRCAYTIDNKNKPQTFEWGIQKFFLGCIFGTRLPAVGRLGKAKSLPR
ncbi:type II toxin-antitoxin system RelE/ParE family toxin [Patescibacteria group bacterium]|nr:type II toxin-antitoxin system RelE/ParE family toxin [Patescibacteria group bacterium]